MPNRLAASTSPYLRQHAENPVDWREWGEEAFAEARERDVPIFLSVGYSACHWCHVMAHESFEDEATAEELNARFVNVKVDREERPDVDAIYMKAVQGMTGRGGWPMSVFLTPDAQPFFAGTYFPKGDRHGMPSFLKVVRSVSEAWAERRDEVVASASDIAASIAQSDALEPVDTIDAHATTRDAAALVLGRAWDRTHGGFGRAPKFPQAMTITWLLTRFDRTGEDVALAAAVQALDHMARGGINDLVGGGFARYSTDERWLVPHFEKMLYDNALLVPAYALAASRTGDAALVRVTAETIDALLTTFAMPDGAFVAAFDADTDGVEGLTAVWTDLELREVVAAAGHDPDRFARFLGVTPEGNWHEGGEGVTVIHEPVPRAAFAAAEGLEPEAFAAAWREVRAALRARRDQRPQPGVDDKVLTDWNGLAIVGLVRAGRALARTDWIDAAARAAEHLHATAVTTAPDGTVRARHTGGIDGFLEDHANLALAYLELFGATGERVWFDRAVALAEAADARFADPDGGWFQTSVDAERLIARPKETWDNATPAGTSVMTEVCRRLFALTGEARWWEPAERALRLLADPAKRMPTGFGAVLRQLEELAAGPVEIVIVGAPGFARDRLERVALDAHHPSALVVVTGPDHGDHVPLLAHRTEVGGQPAAYVCRAMVCERPVTDPTELAGLLDSDVGRLRRESASYTSPDREA
jgi:uncharacterized protein YyaL (SSP411 family)